MRFITSRLSARHDQPACHDGTFIGMDQQSRDTGPAGSARRSPVRRDLEKVYTISAFIGRFFREAWHPPYEWREVIRQCRVMGLRSMGIITLTGFITGIVFTKQSRPSLADFGATSWLPSLVSLALIRALAPLITSLIVAGKIGSNIGAELGSMRVTEQVDAMEVSSANPFKFLVVTRIVALTCMLPLLVTYMAFMGLLGSFLNINQNEQTSLAAFLSNAFGRISFLDLFSSAIKSAVYGFTIGVTGCFMGYNAGQGTVGVGRAANSAVVVSMFLIFIEEVLIVQVVNSWR
jgi:phospholipid/cholesterol/gamma-HCH transport system permease protein